MPPDEGAAEVRRIVAEAEDVMPDCGLDLRRVSDIAARPVRWLWRGRIARGKVTMLAGHPGLGKSQVSLGIAAIVTTGGRWPVDGTRAELGSAVIMSAEDDPEDTIRPRLDAAGADLSRCHIIGAVRDCDSTGRETRRGFSLLEDLPRLAMALDGIGDAALAIIDPVTAYLGATDSHRNAEVRAALAPLAELAAQYNTAVLAVSHLRKSLEGEAILQVSGSLAFAAAARAVYITTRDPGDATRRLLLPAKNNLGDDRTGYAYTIKPVSLPGSITTSRIVWGPDPVTTTADEAMAGSSPSHTEAPRRSVAEGWLQEILADCSVPSAQVRAEAEAAGLAWATVRRAADALGVVVLRVGGIAGAGEWRWSLPRDDIPPDTEAEL
jgi:putative DNA primase/helicase